MAEIQPSWFSARSGLLHSLQIAGPVAGLILSKVIEIVPGIEPGIVTIRKFELDGIRANRLDSLDRDVLLANLEHFLPRPMAAHFRRRRKDAQVFAGELKVLAVVKRDFQNARHLVQLDFSGTR